MRLPFHPTTTKVHHHHHHQQQQQQQSQLLIPIRPPTTTVLRRPTKCRVSSAGGGGKDKIVVIMGATGSGKSRLSVDLASRFFPGSSEIVNSDKMQVYRGLDITTNKIPLPDRRGVPHHLLGDLPPSLGDLPPSHFRLLARSSLSHILSRHRLPLIVGGSNSFIHALVTSQNSHSHSPSPDLLLHYDCCFLWVDVALPVLNQYLFKRVDDMFDSGMLAELAAFYDSLNRPDSVLRPGVGLMKAIGVPEFAHYFSRTRAAGGGDAELFREAVDRIKDNTCRLAEKQMGKIQRLRGGGWEMRRLDATDFFEAVMAGEKTAPAAEEIWEERVLMPTVKIVKSFLEG